LFSTDTWGTKETKAIQPNTTINIHLIIFSYSRYKAIHKNMEL